MLQVHRGHCQNDNTRAYYNTMKLFDLMNKEEIEDTKGVIKIRKSKDRQRNGQKKKDKRTNNDLQNIHIKLKIE